LSYAPSVGIEPEGQTEIIASASVAPCARSPAHLGARPSPLGVLVSTSGLLANLGCERTRRLSRYRASRRQALGDRRTALDGPDDGHVIQTVGVRERSKTLLAAHSINQALLPRREDGVRKNGKIAEHPEQIHALDKCRS